MTNIEKLGAYQRWCVKALQQLLTEVRPSGNENWEMKGYADVLKEIILHYADIYSAEGRHVNIYWNFNIRNRDAFFSNVLMSTAAKEIISRTDWCEGRNLKGRIHFEHILPKQQAMEDLLEAVGKGPISEDVVIQILSHEKIVVITTEESSCFDDRNMTFDEEDISNYGILFPSDADVRRFQGSQCKKSGSALLRMTRLKLKKGSEFCYYSSERPIAHTEWSEALVRSCM